MNPFAKFDCPLNSGFSNQMGPASCLGWRKVSADKLYPGKYCLYTEIMAEIEKSHDHFLGSVFIDRVHIFKN